MQRTDCNCEICAIYDVHKAKTELPLNYYSDTLNAYHKFAKRKNLHPHHIKWPDATDIKSVSRKISKFIQLLNLNSIRTAEVASGLYLIRNQNS